MCRFAILFPHELNKRKQTLDWEGYDGAREVYHIKGPDPGTRAEQFEDLVQEHVGIEVTSRGHENGPDIYQDFSQESRGPRHEDTLSVEKGDNAKSAVARVIVDIFGVLHPRPREKKSPASQKRDCGHVVENKTVTTFR